MRRHRRRPVAARGRRVRAVAAAVDCARETVFERRICEDVGLPQPDPTETDVDNKAAYDTAHGTSPGKNLKHVDRRDFKCREWRARGEIRYKKVGSAENAADFFTKALELAAFRAWRSFWFGATPSMSSILRLLITPILARRSTGASRV